VFHLQKCLGHSTLEMTRSYANMMTEDLLQAVHKRVSLLSSRQVFTGKAAASNYFPKSASFLVSTG